MNFEIEVKTALIKKGMTIKELANELGITPAYTGEIIKGTRKAEHYKKKICKLLSIEMG